MPEKILSSLLHLFCVAGFALAGLFFLVGNFTYAASHRVFFGSFFLGSSLLLTLGFYLMHKGRYLAVSMNASIREELLKEAIEKCIKQPLAEATIDRSQTLHIRLAKPTDDLHNLEEIEKQLGPFLKDHFGYAKDFTLYTKER